MTNLLGSEKEMKWMRAEPYSFKAWGGNGRIVGYDSVKTPLSKKHGSDQT